MNRPRWQHRLEPVFPSATAGSATAMVFRVAASFCLMVALHGLCARTALADEPAANPFDGEGRAHMAQLDSSAAPERARAAEALGYMRYSPAESALRAALKDPVADVRRNAAISLAWCGSRNALEDIVSLLDDEEWVVRQSA